MIVYSKSPFFFCFLLIFVLQHRVACLLLPILVDHLLNVWILRSQYPLLTPFSVPTKKTVLDLSS